MQDIGLLYELLLVVCHLHVVSRLYQTRGTWSMPWKPHTVTHQGRWQHESACTPLHHSNTTREFITRQMASLKIFENGGTHTPWLRARAAAVNSNKQQREHVYDRLTFTGTWKLHASFSLFFHILKNKLVSLANCAAAQGFP